MSLPIKVKINDRETGLLFGLPAVRMIIAKMKMYDLSKGATYTEGSAAVIIFAGYMNHCMVHDQQPEFIFADVLGYLEPLFYGNKIPEDVLLALKGWEESTYVKPSARKAEAEQEEKKTLIGTTSNQPAMENSD